MAGKRLSGCVCIVTGATRGIGKGIARQLAQAGAIVYITGRTLKAGENRFGGSLTETAEQIELQGGQCIPVQCDHNKDEDVNSLFDRVNREQDGRLDILVNNAYSAASFISENMKVPFWDQPLESWDITNSVGLRNHYICSVLAARLMVPRKAGLIVNISSAGGLRYLFSVPYGVGKAAVDRMAADCAVELRKKNVACVSLWPGAVATETITTNLKDAPPSQADLFLKYGESADFSGLCITRLFTDPELMKKSGRVLLTADLGDEYSVTELDGSVPHNLRRPRDLLQLQGYTRLASWIPHFIKFPRVMFALVGNKF